MCSYPVVFEKIFAKKDHSKNVFEEIFLENLLYTDSSRHFLELLFEEIQQASRWMKCLDLKFVFA